MTTNRPHHGHHHDDHLALVIDGSYERPVTTAQVADRVDRLIQDFEDFRSHVRHIATIATIAGGTALAAVIGLVVIR